MAVKAHGAKKGLGRHFEGWQPGLLAVLFAGVSALLAVPRSVVPEIPEPLLAPRALEQVARGDAALAAEAERAQLHTDVREVGTAMRAYGLADASGDDRALGMERVNVARAVERARALENGEHKLALLRAYQLRSFLRELHRWEHTGEVSDELRELGGRFVETVQHDGWVEEGKRRLLMDDAARAALFKKRWDEITLTRGAEFDPTREENVALLRFLLLHPPRDLHASPSDPPAVRERAEFAKERYRLHKIDELRALDPSYPADLARGAVFYRLHRYAQATEAFRTYIDAHEGGGPYLVRANNYLRAAIGADLGEHP